MKQVNESIYWRFFFFLGLFVFVWATIYSTKRIDEKISELEKRIDRLEQK